MKNGRLRRLEKKESTSANTIIAKVTAPTSKTNHLSETAAHIPSVIEQKYADNSKGERTGFRKRTIDSAPTIPKDNAILPDITLVIT